MMNIKRNTMEKMYLLRKLFFLTMMIGIIMLIIVSIFSHGEWAKSIFYSQSTGREFSDYWYALMYSRTRHPYQISAERTIGFPYPPLSFLFYYLAGVSIPDAYFKSYSVLAHQTLSIGYLVAMMVLFHVFLIELLVNFAENNKVERILIAFCVLFSAPLLFNYERANNVLCSMCFLCIFVFFNNSSNKIVREMSYFSLAISAGLKLSPAIFGVIILREKRWKVAIRCVIYGVMLFVLPFFWFDGLADLIKLREIIHSYIESYGNTCSGFRVDFTNAFKIVLTQMGKDKLVNEDICKILSFILSSALLASSFITKEKWKSLLALSLIVTGSIELSFTYNLIYIFIPLLYFLYKDSYQSLDWIYLILFILMLVPIPFYSMNFIYDEISVWPITLQTYVEEMSVIMIAVIIVTETFSEALITCLMRKRAKRIRGDV